MKVTLDPVFRSLSGHVGSLVYYQSYGRQYARAYVVPRNPDTPAQRQGRTRFAEAVDAWQKLPELHKEIWRIKAHPLNRTGYNLFISIYLAGDNASDSLVLRYAYKAAPLLPVFFYSDAVVRLYEGCMAGKYANSPPTESVFVT
ncbi:MAG: hypothetical protein ACRCUT_10995 [Spirochaetota bacterium]